MSGRHQPVAGADSEPITDPRDWHCDRCARYASLDTQHQVTNRYGNIEWLCDKCYEAAS